jgi:hypothetical protein
VDEVKWAGHTRPRLVIGEDPTRITMYAVRHGLPAFTLADVREMTVMHERIKKMNASGSPQDARPLHLDKRWESGLTPLEPEG